MTRLLCILTIAMSTACAADDGDCAPVDTMPVEVGTGDLVTGFVALEDGAEIPIVLGPQGLHMIVMSGRVIDGERLGNTDADHRVTVGIRSRGELVGGTLTDLPPAMTSEGHADFLGLRAVFTIAEVTPLAGQDAEVVITVEDQCGGQHSGTRTIRLAL